MKKFGLFCVAAMAGLTVTAVQTGNAGHATSSEPVVMAAQKSFSKQNYAVMAYLKYTKQDVNSVQDNSVEIDSEHGRFEIDNEGGEDFDVTVNNTNVTLKTTDQKGKKKTHTYSKANLEKQFNNQQSKLNSIVEKDN